MKTPSQIASELTPAEAWQLKLLNRGRRTGAPLPDQKALIDSLIAKGLAEDAGTAVYITWLGHEVLSVLP
jgi:hypothetical protein